MAKEELTDEEKEEQEKLGDDPIARQRKDAFKIFSMVGDGFDEEDEKEEAETEEEKAERLKTEEAEAAKEKKPDDEPPPDEPPEKKEDEPPAKPTVEVRKKPAPTPDIPAFEPEKREAPKPHEPEVKKPAGNEVELMPDERDEVEIAQWAEKLSPGIEKKVRDFIQKRREFVAEKVKEEGRGYRPTRDSDYQDWLEENNPLPTSQRRKWERQKDREELKQEFEKGSQKTQAELKRELEALKLKPGVEKKGLKFRQDLETSLPETLKEVFPEIEDAASAMADMRPFVDPITERYSAMAETFLMLNAGAIDFDAQNRAHAYIDDFIDKQSRFFEANGGANLFRDGKRFVRRDLWPQVPKEKQHLYWTFTEADIVDVFAEKSKMETKETLQSERKKWEIMNARLGKKAEPDGKGKPNGKGKEKPPAEKSKVEDDEDLGVKAEVSGSPGAGKITDQTVTPPSFFQLQQSHGR